MLHRRIYARLRGREGIKEDRTNGKRSEPRVQKRIGKEKA
jgi:hypothetical protein